MTDQLFPKPPRVMKQPRKDVLREQLVLAARTIEQQRDEIARLAAIAPRARGPAYYNENDPYVAEWLQNLIARGLIPAGDVDTRSIVDVQPDDLIGYRQCHFFAGIGGWALAARLAGWPDDRELWTGSCPCQPFSAAGKGLGHDDERHLWPHQLRLPSARRPAVWMGEQVAAAVGKDWLDGVLADVEAIGYAGRAAVVPACAVDAPHRRDRLWIVADSSGKGLAKRERERGVLREVGGGQQGENLADDHSARLVVHTDIPGASEERQQRSGEQRGARVDSSARTGDMADATSERSPNRDAGALSGRAVTGRQAVELERCRSSAWASAGWIVGHDGKARRVEPSIRLLAHGVPARVGRLRAYGNAIVPQVAAEVIAAYIEHTAVEHLADAA